MEKFNEAKKQNTKKNTRLAALLILILVVIIGLISFVVIDYISGPSIEQSINTYTIKNVGNKYKNNDKYWTLEVGEDIPQGYYSITKESSDPYKSMEVSFSGSDELREKAYDEDIDISLVSSFYLKEEFIDNIFLPEGTSLKFRTDDVQDVKLEKLENPNKLDLSNSKKLGTYNTSQETLTIPLVTKESDLEVVNNIEIYSISPEEEILYECYRNTCDYDKINRETDEGESKEIILENELGKDATDITVDLLDKTYIVVQ